MASPDDVAQEPVVILIQSMREHYDYMTPFLSNEWSCCNDNFKVYADSGDEKWLHHLYAYQHIIQFLKTGVISKWLSDAEVKYGCTRDQLKAARRHKRSGASLAQELLLKHLTVHTAPYECTRLVAQMFIDVKQRGETADKIAHNVAMLMPNGDARAVIDSLNYRGIELSPFEIYWAIIGKLYPLEWCSSYPAAFRQIDMPHNPFTPEDLKPQLETFKDQEDYK